MADYPSVPSSLQGKAGLQWSPSRQQWRDGSGNTYDASGMPPSPSEGISPIGAFARGAAAGFGKTVLGTQELLGKGLEELDLPGGQWLVSDAERGAQYLNEELAADRSILGGGHPIASEIGEFAGGLIGPGGVAKNVANPALRAALAGSLGAMLQPETPEVRGYWMHKAEEAAIGGSAGVALEKTLAGAARVIAPRLRPEADQLIKEGVLLTPGQAAGGRWRRFEDSLASVSIAGHTVRNAQRLSVETFNRAAINRSLEDIGTQLPTGLNSGTNAVAFAEQRFRDAYAQVIPNMRGQIDAPFQNRLVAILQRAQQDNLPPEFRDQLRHIIGAEVVARFNAGGGTISGEDAQKIGTQLDVLMRAARQSPNPYAQHLGRLVKDVDAALDDMMARNNPKLQASKDRIDLGYSKFKIIQKAAADARNMKESPDGTFTPAQLRAAVRARDTSKDKAAFARGDAQMQDLAAAAVNVLPQTVPDSGTPERMAVLGLLGSIGYLEPRVAVALGLPAAAYTKPGIQAFNKLLQPAGPIRQGFSDATRAVGPILAPVAGNVSAEFLKPTSQTP